MIQYIDFTVKEAVDACGGTFSGEEGYLDQKFTSVVIDSRKVCADSLFVAIKGEKTDGYDYIPSAIESGALCAVSEKAYPDFPCIVAEDPVKALQDIARAYRSKLNITVIGITGSVGKTTTKEVVASVLSQKYNVIKTEGNFNNGLGLPLTVMSIKRDTEVAVVEMGMNHFGEMRLLSSIAKPTMCIMTNIGVSHIENLGSRENIFTAKSEIFEYMAPTARCIFNGDDDILTTAQRHNKCMYGFSDKNDIYIESFIEHGFDGTDFSVSLFGESVKCKINVPGRHVLYAAMAAMAAGSWLGLTKDQLACGIESARSVSGRLNVIRTAGYTIIDDCYNAAPQSVKSGIDLLSKCDKHNRSVCILGDMLELGEDSPLLHYHVGLHAANSKIGLLIAIGDISQSTYCGCTEHGGNAVYYKTKEDFLNDADNILQKDDIILIKASHSMNFTSIVDYLKNIGL